MKLEQDKRPDNEGASTAQLYSHLNKQEGVSTTSLTFHRLLLFETYHTGISRAVQ
jgi:hypothetical protein